MPRRIIVLREQVVDRLRSLDKANDFAREMLLQAQPLDGEERGHDCRQKRQWSVGLAADFTVDATGLPRIIRPHSREAIGHRRELWERRTKRDAGSFRLHFTRDPVNLRRVCQLWFKELDVRRAPCRNTRSIDLSLSTSAPTPASVLDRNSPGSENAPVRTIQCTGIRGANNLGNRVLEASLESTKSRRSPRAPPKERAGQ